MGSVWRLFPTGRVINSLPVWLPDGLHIAFRTTDNQGLWWWRTAKLDGSAIEKISQPSYDFFSQTPAWSPDGTRIAYMSLEEQKKRNDGASQIHIKDIDGKNDYALTHDTWENATPVWSPDGRLIAFLSERHGEPNIFALYVMRADGAGVKQLSKPVYSDVSALFSWSPDGKQIAIGDVNIGHITIITIADGESQELLYLKDGEAIYAPAWQP
jgi:TolB protein